jgi:hypothetical protein
MMRMVKWRRRRIEKGEKKESEEKIRNEAD